jgi:hypothetical protein
MSGTAIVMLVAAMTAQLAPGVPHEQFIPGHPQIHGGAGTPMPGMMPGHGGGGEAPVPTFDLVALQASVEGQEKTFIDPKLKKYSKLLKTMPFDTFRLVAQHEKTEAPIQQDTLIPINGVYSAHLFPEPDQQSGELSVKTRIEMMQGEDFVNALFTQANIAPGKPLVFRGLDLNVGEMIVILKLVQEDGDDEQDQSSDEEQDQDQEQDDNQEQEPEQNEEQQEEEGDGEGEPQPQDLSDVNIDALLQSLAEMDKREQEEAKNTRDGIEIRKNWW